MLDSLFSIGIFYTFFFFFFLPHCSTLWDLTSWLGSNPHWKHSLNHWTTMEVLIYSIFKWLMSKLLLKLDRLKNGKYSLRESSKVKDKHTREYQIWLSLKLFVWKLLSIFLEQMSQVFPSPLFLGWDQFYHLLFQVTFGSCWLTNIVPWVLLSPDGSGT